LKHASWRRITASDSGLSRTSARIASQRRIPSAAGVGEHHDCHDDDGVGNLADGGGDRRRDQQHDDHQLGELPEQHHQRPGTGVERQPVFAIALAPAEDIVGGKTALGLDRQIAKHRVGGARVGGLADTVFSLGRHDGRIPLLSLSDRLRHYLAGLPA
jgi:hypothetical protein